MSDEPAKNGPVFVARVWNGGGRGHWESEGEVVTLKPGEVYEFDDQFYSFAVEEVREAR